MRAVACAVLAAGGSRRLGRPKQLVPYQGRPLVRHVVEQVLAASFSARAVVLGANADAISSALGDAPIERPVNDVWLRGIASSIRVATRWAIVSGAEALVLVLADQPLIAPAHLEALVAAWTRDVPAVASAHEGVLGVPALFDASCFPGLLGLVGDRGAASLLRHDGRVIAVPWGGSALDIDTEEDLAALALR